MRLIGVDVGAPLPISCSPDTETGQTLIHKVPTTPDDPSRGVVAGIGELVRALRIGSRRNRPCAARHDDRDQRGTRI